MLLDTTNNSLSTHSPLEGVSITRNRKNGFLVFELHYTADPSKKDSDEIARIKAAMPIAQFRQEFDLEWDSFSGMPVYQDFQVARHASKEPLRPWAGLPLLRGWDFGLTPALVTAQLQEQTLVILHEFTDVNTGAERFCEKYLPQWAQLYPEWAGSRERVFDFADPAGVAKAQSDETTCFQVLGSFGLSPIPGPVTWEERRQAVEHFLTKRTRGGECFLIDQQNASVTFKGFKGGYRYPERAQDVEPALLRPIKNRYSHPQDAVQYIASCVRRGGLRAGTSSIPALSYFSRGSS